MLDKKKIIKGGFYLTIVNVISQLLSVVVNIVLARLLLPEHFGLIALATTYIGFITLFTNIGYGSSIIHEQKSTQQQLSSIYWTNIAFSVLSFLIVILTVPFAAAFYNEPSLKKVVWIASLSILLSPFFSIHYKIKERDLEFKYLSKITIISTLSGSSAAIIGAFVGMGVYALVLQILVATAVRLFLILVSSEWKPSFEFEFKSIRSMIWYSLKYKASNSVLYFERNIDYMILGKIFSSVVLGYYAFAYNIMYTPVKRISYIFSNVLFPSFSSIKEDKQKIITAYFKSIQLIALISFPAMTLLAFNADLIINFIFGEKWTDAIPIVQILCFAGAIQSISQVGGVIFSSIGKPEINLYIGISRTLLTTIAIIIGSFYGILNVAYLLVVAKMLSFLIFLAVLHHHIPFLLLKLVDYLKGPIISVLSLVILQIFTLRRILVINDFKKLVIMISFSFILLVIFHYHTLKELYTILRAKSKIGDS